MSRNVTEFKHLMKNRFITENDLDWVINLRDNCSPVTNKSQLSGPPEVYFKKTKAFQNKTHKDENQQQTRVIPN